jgi:hypothetical protein
MQRSIDRLIKATVDLGSGEKDGRVIDENGKIKFNRLMYDLDTYLTILSKI